MSEESRIKICTKCGSEKALSEFSFRYKNKGILQPWCRPCTRLHNMSRYYANHDYYRKHHTKLTEAKRREKAKKVFEYLIEHPSVDCGEADPVVLEFDHRDGTEKVDAVTQMITHNCGLKKIFTEIEKCDVRCANCHRRRTATKRGYARAVLFQELNENKL